MKTIFNKFLLLAPAALILMASCSNDDELKDSFNYAGTDVYISNVFVDTLGVNADSTTTTFRLTMASSGIERDTTGALVGTGSAIELDLVSKFGKLKQGTYLIDNNNTGEKLTGTGAVYFNYNVETGATPVATFTSGIIEIDDKAANRYEIEIEALNSNGERFESEWCGKLSDFEYEAAVDTSGTGG